MTAAMWIDLGMYVLMAVAASITAVRGLRAWRDLRAVDAQLKALRRDAEVRAAERDVEVRAAEIREDGLVASSPGAFYLALLDHRREGRVLPRGEA